MTNNSEMYDQYSQESRGGGGGSSYDRRISQHSNHAQSYATTPQVFHVTSIS